MPAGAVAGWALAFAAVASLLRSISPILPPISLPINRIAICQVDCLGDGFPKQYSA
jgi:hypothetical protein